MPHLNVQSARWNRNARRQGDLRTLKLEEDERVQRLFEEPATANVASPFGQNASTHFGTACPHAHLRVVLRWQTIQNSGLPC
eukprot:3223222-Pleurochrysis_carterae.AAC.2